jgi:YidC/Oxa1 family membrane protein insertase
MPEIQNPNHRRMDPNGVKNLEMLYSLALIAFVLLSIAGYQYKFKQTIPEPLSTRQAQPETQPKYPTTSPAASLATGQASAPKTQTSPTTRQPSESQTDFGWLSVIAKPLYLALRFLYSHRIANWGWAIIAFTVIFNLAMLWPRTMSMRSSLKTMRIQPKVEALKKRYAHLKISDPKRAEMNAELMALYKSEDTNLYGGCLPVLLQTPLLFAYASVLRNAVELHHAHWFWITDLSQPDPLHVLPILIIASMSFTQFITPTPTMNPGQRRLLAFMMPAIMGFTLWHYASGLALYWATGNIVNLIIQFFVNRSAIGREMQSLVSRNKEQRT